MKYDVRAQKEREFAGYPAEDLLILERQCGRVLIFDREK